MIAGEFEVDVTARIHGTIKVGLPFEQAFTASVPWETIAMACFDKLNAATKAKVLTEVTTAWDSGELDALREEVADRVNDETWGVFAAMKDRTVKEVNGKVTPRLAVEFV